MNDTSCVFEIIHLTMQQSSNTLSVSRLCATAGVSRSGYYAWVAAEPLRAAREEQDRNTGHYESQEDPAAHEEVQLVLPCP